MSTLSLRLPESLHKAAKALAKKENVSINQLITLALAEKISAMETTEYLSGRNLKTRQSKYLGTHKRASDEEPDEQDKL